MLEEKIKKYESKERLEELNPKKTLERLGFREGSILCDIGAGTGIFSFPATELSKNDIYALDVSDKMLELLEERKKSRGVRNLKIKKVENNILPVADNTCDLAIMITVLHHVEDKKFMFSEIGRVLKSSGRLTIVEFYKKDAEMGPPKDIRISEDELVEIGKKNGLEVVGEYSFGENFYSKTFKFI